MTQEHAVIQGSFINYKRYPRQGCTHLLVEIPIEYTNKYVSILGEPTAAYPIPVALAVLNEISAHRAITQGEGGGDQVTSKVATTDFETPDFRV